LKISYDGLGDTLSILVGRERIARAEEQEPIITNFDIQAVTDIWNFILFAIATTAIT
jgi:hypothetical protein